MMFNGKENKTTTIIFNLFLDACFCNLFGVKGKPKFQIPHSVFSFSAQNKD